jgi:hypothetical protein
VTTWAKERQQFKDQNGGRIQLSTSISGYSEIERRDGRAELTSEGT